jgi:hypothetical protein
MQKVSSVLVVAACVLGLFLFESWSQGPSPSIGPVVEVFDANRSDSVESLDGAALIAVRDALPVTMLGKTPSRSFETSC